MVLFKYTGGGQIEAPSIHASDLTVENQPETGEHEEYVCSANMASVIAKCVPSYVTSVLYQISFKQKCAQYQETDTEHTTETMVCQDVSSLASLVLR